MKKDKVLRDQKSSQKIASKFKNKDWVKKLEEASGKTIEAPIKAKYLYMLIDCSSSMSSNDKMQQAKAGGIAFINDAIEKKYNTGLISFASSGKLEVKASKSDVSLHDRVKRLSASGSTDLTSALHIAHEELNGKYGEKVLCVVTDGMPNDSQSALEIAKQLHAKDIDIMAIGTDDADQSFLRQLCNRNELSVKVESYQLREGITSMTKMLLGPSD